MEQNISADPAVTGVKKVPAAEIRSSRTLSIGLSLASVLLLFACLVSWHIELPGLYMDAVNPDFEVVDVLQGPTDSSPIFFLPGNFIANRLPLLTAMYHGTQNIWVDLPVVAVFGPSVASLRAAQALFGAAILVAMFFFLRNRDPDAPLLLIWLATVALALDPVFIYAFRTQFYITLGPVAWLLASLIAGRRAFQSGPDSAQDRWNKGNALWLVLAGLCFGASVFGYFIFIFFLPVLVPAIVITYRLSNKEFRWLRLAKVLIWISIGFLLGIAGYIIGYLKIMQEQHGLQGFLDFYAGYSRGVGGLNTHLSLLETIHFFSDIIWRVFSNAWQHTLMFDEAWSEPGSVLKILLLLGLPLLLLVWCEARTVRSWRLRLMVGLTLCFPVVALVFGNRLSGHHFIVLLPLAYVALAMGLVELYRHQPARSSMKIGAISLCLVLIVINISGQCATGTELLSTHGRHLFSDAINHFAEDANAQETDINKQHFYFPDWGLLAPFHFLTGGKIRHSQGADITDMHAELCRGHSVSIALVTGDIPERFTEISSKLSWKAPDLIPYNAYEGDRVFTIGTFKALPQDAPQNAGCPH